MAAAEERKPAFSANWNPYRRPLHRSSPKPPKPHRLTVRPSPQPPHLRPPKPINTSRSSTSQIVHRPLLIESSLKVVSSSMPAWSKGN
ncbi:hypothetical protein BJ508DRAFT_121228 [Ascobolus immersus RN42]|uniref:Uncharacterized protein n=1 Tax=Ascobolus immersus RN42 TaxID=1160509 RepID=A0A3N4IYZ0_ASCIM|nr:hypothetical protein BJ508DRAFT_121228 [Ascobolus immersus RN42]